MQQPSSDAQLKRAFHFTDDDIDHNRQHQLSERQIHRLSRRMYRNLFFGGSAIVLFVIVGTWALFYLQFMVTVFGYGLSVVIGYLLQRQYHTTRSTFALGAVEHVRGKIQITRRPKSTGEAYTRASVCSLTIGWMRFDLTEAQCKALYDGGDYSVYFLTGLGVVLSVERHDVTLPMF